MYISALQYHVYYENHHIIIPDHNAGDEARLWRSCCRIRRILYCCQTGENLKFLFIILSRS